MKKTILSDKRYPSFVKEFQNDPLKFAIVVVKTLLSQDQTDLFVSIAPRSAKVSVVSGTGTGKTFAFGVIATWHLLCFPYSLEEGEYDDDTAPVLGSNTYIAAPRIKQVSEGVWKEMNDVFMAIAGNKKYSWLCDYYEITKMAVYIKGYSSQWFVHPVAMQAGQSVGIAGKHRYWQLIIIDEAAGVSNDHFKVVDGTQTQGGNRTLLASQGVKNSGHFFDTHHKLSAEKGGSWKKLKFSSLDSPHVEEQWIIDRLMETGGASSTEFIVRVLGGFADGDGSNLMTRDDIEAGFNRGKIIKDNEPYGIIILVDIGMGEYRDDSVAVVARIIGYDDATGANPRRVEFFEIPYCTNSKNQLIFAGDIANLYGLYSNPTLLVDNGGIGSTVTLLIEGNNVPVVRVMWGEPCFRKTFRERYVNRRDCGNVRLRDALRTGRVSFPNNISVELREKIILQGSRLPYHFVENGGLKYKMDSKDAMKKNGIDSPDLFDCFAFAFTEYATYHVSDETRGNEITTRTESANRTIEAMLED